MVVVSDDGIVGFAFRGPGTATTSAAVGAGGARVTHPAYPLEENYQTPQAGASLVAKRSSYQFCQGASDQPVDRTTWLPSQAPDNPQPGIMPLAAGHYITTTTSTTKTTSAGDPYMVAVRDESKNGERETGWRKRKRKHPEAVFFMEAEAVKTKSMEAEAVETKSIGAEAEAEASRHSGDWYNM